MCLNYCKVPEDMKHNFLDNQNQTQTDDIIFRAHYNTPFEHKIDDITHASCLQQLQLKCHTHSLWVWGDIMWHCTCVCQWPSWKDRTKEGSYQMISYAEVKETQTSHTSHSMTRVMMCDTITSDRVLPTRYILSGKFGSLCATTLTLISFFWMKMRTCF